MVAGKVSEGGRVLLQRHVKLEGVGPLEEAHAKISVAAGAVAHAEDKVARGVEDGLDGDLRILIVERALREERVLFRVEEFN